MSDTEITFQSGPVTLFGSLRLVAGPDRKAPAALILAGSGPTDRNGDSTLLEGDIGTLRFIANVLEEQGISSLRYDKIGSGETGLGPYEIDEIADLGFNTYVDAASDGLDFLAQQPGVDADRLIIVGHSDGAIVALAVATAQEGARVSSLALVEPLSVRLLDLLTNQIHGQLDAVVGAGQLPVELADELRVALAGAVESLRTDGTVSDDLPEPLRNAGLVYTNAKALAEEDALDPVALVARLPAGMPVLTSCSAKDIQIVPSDVAALDEALSHTSLTSVRMRNTSFVLKDLGDEQSTGADYVAPLPYSDEFAKPFAEWVRSLA
ncbi:alpha/beta fold hydrolase [Rhodococcus sp. IEGM 1379]|uniref:alpha/beta hydrolase n=1 Tax=Rhodococcus sp. IEGM 1379 TaxID=3047086 RepID=UPI0024B65964|nr:alpha/beta fold hydrolase [Rhodococcus sp. IEGM 1379]MDI9918397.1 alpha/beta fold hydrolase [Rhodococcus sp. IEGM 1379]